MGTQYEQAFAKRRYKLNFCKVYRRARAIKLHCVTSLAILSTFKSTLKQMQLIFFLPETVYKLQFLSCKDNVFQTLMNDELHLPKVGVLGDYYRR